MPVRVALDAMGGDHAPAEVVKGAVEAASEQIHVILFGDHAAISAELARHPANSNLSIQHTSQQVEMQEHAVEAFRRKPDSSLRRAIESVRSGETEAVFSAGNTGAMMTTAFLTLGVLEGVQRPAIAATMPTSLGQALLLDAGANVDCDVEHLYQFGLMGSIFVSAAWGIESPSVGLLNIGDESSKGDALTKQAFDRLKVSPLNFVGNVEAQQFFEGRVDVLVCDGFVGNVLLKGGEGVVEMVARGLREMAPDLGAEVVSQVIQKLLMKMDYAAKGAAPLLGVNGVCMIGHGRSRAPAISNAIRGAAHCAATSVVARIREGIRQQSAAR